MPMPKAQRWKRGSVMTWTVLLSGCAGSQSVLAPAGPQAEQIAAFWWAMLVTAVLILVLVVGLLLIGLARARGAHPAHSPNFRRSRNLVVAGGVVIPAIILLGFVYVSVSLGQRVAGAPPADALTIEVHGRLWWWEVHYLDEQGERTATTANEIHIPVGRPVRFLLRSDNVIHSFWVPKLQGKLDMIPGRENVSWLQADVAGVYRGQCAEFCGAQHALMAFVLVAEPPARFAAWLRRQRQPAAEPTTPEQARGQAVFLRAGCIACHTLRGTPAQGRIGPDLTHVGSRLTLAAATLPNTRGNLGGWILDPQHVKPGNLMPSTLLEPGDVKALLAYLEALR